MIVAMAELRDLRCFAVLSEVLHFGKAADRMAISQSTLSRRIRALEDELGMALLVRTSRRVALTDPGRELATRLPAALRSVDQALEAARSKGAGGWEV